MLYYIDLNKNLISKVILVKSKICTTYRSNFLP